MKPNKNFELSVNDVDIIERALYSMINNSTDNEKREIHDLLGRIHNQKNWYRPKTEPYISG